MKQFCQLQIPIPIRKLGYHRIQKNVERMRILRAMAIKSAIYYKISLESDYFDTVYFKQEKFKMIFAEFLKDLTIECGILHSASNLHRQIKPSNYQQKMITLWIYVVFITNYVQMLKVIFKILDKPEDLDNLLKIKILWNLYKLNLISHNQLRNQLNIQFFFCY